MFFNKRIHSSMSRTTVTLKFKIYRLRGKHKKPTTMTKPKESRVESL